MHLLSLLGLLVLPLTVLAQQSGWGQCGGDGWTGPTTCVSGFTCVFQNQWYSQCVPSSATTGPTSTTTASATTTTRPPTSTGTYRNPIKEPNGSDPFMVWSNGYYYLLTTTWTNIQITRATTINGLKTATPKVVYNQSTPDRCCNWWAPEIHWQPREGAWYIYYSAGPRDSWERAHALKGSSTDIWASTWTYAGAPAPPNRDVASLIIDGTVLIRNNVRYFIFSSWDTGGQCLFISEMTSATTLGNATRISCPDLSWEQVGNKVQEGPAALYHGNRTWVVYSASFCSGTGYKLGRLELTGSNPLLTSSWTKFGSPIFTSANGNYQPGHNGFFTGPSGNNVYNVYHANHNSPGQCDGSRYTNVAPVNWNSDGTPNLGSPPPLTSDLAEPW